MCFYKKCFTCKLRSTRNGNKKVNKKLISDYFIMNNENIFSGNMNHIFRNKHNFKNHRNMFCITPLKRKGLRTLKIQFYIILTVRLGEMSKCDSFLSSFSKCLHHFFVFWHAARKSMVTEVSEFGLRWRVSPCSLSMLERSLTAASHNFQHPVMKIYIWNKWGMRIRMIAKINSSCWNFQKLNTIEYNLIIKTSKININ